jgi:Nucleotidyl transferase of unknown function (DUF2204)
MLKDQKELLSEFNAHGVEYLIVGGHAVNLHGVPRTTKDLDVLIRDDEQNSEKVYAALASFGAPLHGLTQADFRDHPDQILQIGVEPSRVDILQAIPGITFDEAWANRVEGRIDKDLTAPFLGREDLILNKELTGRPRDLGDVAELREVKRVRDAAGQVSEGKTDLPIVG